MHLSIHNKKILITFSIFIKVLFLFLFSYWNSPINFTQNLQLYAISGDSQDYIQPIENLISKGKYYFQEDNFAGRMPGFGVIYLPLRIFLSQHWALNFTLIFQAVFSGVSVYYLAKIFYYWTTSESASLFVFFLYAICTYVSAFDGIILMESVSTSSLILSTYFFIKYFEGVSKKKIYLFISGLFLTWSVFSRPSVLPIFGIYSLVIIFKYKNSIKDLIVLNLCFLSSFFVLDGAWIVRNYFLSDGKIIPLQSTISKGGLKKPFEQAQFDFIKSFGGDVVWWNHNSEGMWFRTDEYLDKYGFQRPNDNIFPEVIFTDYLTIDTLKYARYCWQQSQNESLTQKELTYFQDESFRVLSQFRNNFIEKHKFYYYIYSPMKIAYKFIVQPYTYYIPYSFSDVNVFLKAFKALNYIINMFIFIMGTFSVFWIFIFQHKSFNYISFINTFIVMFVILLFSVVFRNFQYRYIITAFPYLTLCAIFLCNFYYEAFLYRKKIN